MAFDKRTNLHTQSLGLKDENGANILTKELIKGSYTEKVASIEGFRLKNALVADDGDQSVNKTMSPEVGISKVSTNNPYGSVRWGYKPKSFSDDEIEFVRNYGDLKFEEANFEQAQFFITSKFQTPMVSINSIDTGTGDTGWALQNIQSTVTKNVFAAMVRKLNFETYSKFYEAALESIDSVRGKSGGLVQARLGDEESYSNQLIDQIEYYKNLENDRFVDGFEDEEVIVILEKLGWAKLTKERLQIFDGQYGGDYNEFYTGLYDKLHKFNNSPVVKTKFLNAPNTPANEKKVHVITVTGPYAPFAFELPIFDGTAEVLHGSGKKQLSIYGQMVYGMEIVDILSQYITVATLAEPVERFEGINMKNVIIDSTNTPSVEFGLDFYNALETDDLDLIAKIVPIHIDGGNLPYVQIGNLGTVTELGKTFSYDGNDSNGESLEKGTSYNVLIAIADAGTLIPLTDSAIPGKGDFKIRAYTRIAK